MSVETLVDELNTRREIPMPWLLQELGDLVNECIYALPNSPLQSKLLVMRHVLEHLECVPKEGM